MQNVYTRKEISDQLGIGPETLRYYEKIAVIPMPSRTEAGYRVYRDADLQRLKFIKKAKVLGFSLAEISHIFQLLNPDKDITDQLFVEQISSKIAEINQKINALTELRETLDSVKNNKPLSECGLLNFFYQQP